MPVFTSIGFLITLVSFGLLLYVFINRLNQKDDFEDRDN